MRVRECEVDECERMLHWVRVLVAVVSRVKMRRSRSLGYGALRWFI